VGGTFTSVGYGSGTIDRPYLAALDAGSGQLVESFNPKPDNAVYSLLKNIDGSRLYVGGVFNRIGGCTPCDRLAALDPSTGAANPGFHPQPNANVATLALGGRTLYLGGTFTVVAGVSRPRLAAVDAITGGLGTKLTLAPNQAVRDMALNSTASTLYLAGAFTLDLGDHPLQLRLGWRRLAGPDGLEPERPRPRLGGRAVARQRHRLSDHLRRQREHLRRRARVGDRHAGHRVGHPSGEVAQRR